MVWKYRKEHLPSAERLIDAGVAKIDFIIRSSIEKKGTAVLGLSGGSTPGPVYQKLATHDLPWDKVHIFLIDDRIVEDTHKDSNQRLCKDTILSAAIPKDNVVFPDTNLPVEKCVNKYNEDIKTLIEKHGPCDLAVLGLVIFLGEDGHLASLFPPVIDSGFSSAKYAVHTTTERFAIFDRITVTMPVIEQSKNKGENKQPVWKEMEEAEMNPKRWPAHCLLRHESTLAMFTP